MGAVMAGDRVTVSEYAALQGWSTSYTRRLKRTGRLVMDASGMVDVSASDARLREARDPGRGGDRTNLTASIYSVEAAREKRATAQLRELELARLAGELVLAADVAALVFDQARTGREAIMSIPDRIAVLIAAESDPVAVHAKLTAECRKVCEFLSGQKPKQVLSLVPDAGVE